MDVILRQLGELLLRAVPTFLLVVLLHFYLKFVFFKPMAKVMRERYDATEGAKKRAEESLERAAKKTAEYETAMRAARAEVYKTQEQAHKELQDRETAALESARRSAEALVNEAKARLAKDVEDTRLTLAADSESLANQIASSILSRGAAA
jgi:F-type H+-transporting ATPase subunit b